MRRLPRLLGSFGRQRHLLPALGAAIMLTYKQLSIALEKLDQGDNNITIEIDGEFYQGDYKIVFNDDRLDDGHLVITTK
jgi:hypothetical protein